MKLNRPNYRKELDVLKEKKEASVAGAELVMGVRGGDVVQGEMREVGRD